MPKKGYKQNKIHRDKISKTMQGKMPKYIPDNNGIKRTPEQRKKYSEVFKKDFASGKRTPWNKGKKGIISSKKGKHYPNLCGEKHHNWKGGLPVCKDCGKKLSTRKAKYCIKCCLNHKIGCKNNLTKDKNYISFLKNKHYKLKKLQNKNGSQHTFGEWESLKAQYNWTCPCCEKSEPNIILTEDHIVPLSRGGSDNIENIQPLCKSCNCKKHTKIIFYE